MYKARCAKKFLSIILALCVLVSLAGCQIVTNTELTKTSTPTLGSGALLAENELTVGINASNSPYGGTNSSNKTVGLDVDIAAAIADELGLELQIVDVASNGKSVLGTSQIDVAMGVTKSGSSTAVSYSSAYLNDGASLYCLEQNVPEDISSVDFSRQTILVQENSTASYEVQEALGIDSVKAYSNVSDVLNALVAQEGTYAALDAVSADYFARSYPGVSRVAFLSSESVTPIYMLTQTSNTDLTLAVQNALETITQNGTLRVIVDKWLGTQGENLLPGQVNIAEIPDILNTM